MRPTYHLAVSVAIAALISQPGQAQTPPPDLSAIAVEAEAAASAAERAAVAAQANSDAAKKAAQAARYAAEAASGRTKAPDTFANSGAGFDPLALGQQFERSRLSSSVGNGPNDRLLRTGTIPEAQLVVSEEKTVASIALSIDVGGDFVDDKLVTNQIVLRAFGNLKDGQSNIVALSGFSNGAGFSFGFARYETAVNLQELANITPAKLKYVFEACKADPTVTDKEMCTVNNPGNGGISALMARYDPKGLRDQLDKIITGNTRFYGIDFTGSQANYSFLDRATFKPDKVGKFEMSGSVYGGFIDRRGNWSVTGFAEYGRRYEPNDPVTLCQPVAQTTLTQCFTAPDGAPSRETELLLGVEWRQQFRVTPGGAPFAIAPRFEYDTESDRYALAVPMYFASDGEGKLRGGLRAVYENTKQADMTRKGAFALTLFVGVPFSIFSK